MTELLEAGVHYGHQTKRWNPKMKDFIFEEKNSIYIIDLAKTVDQLEKAKNFLAETVRGGGKVLFIGCKKQAQDAIKEAAQACGQYYVNQRWLGGTLTNLTTIRKSVARMKYIEDLQKSPNFSRMNKREASVLKREAAKILKNLEGVRDMDKQPDVVVIIDTKRESIAVAEARRLKIPIVALVDTNSDPEIIDHPVAGNDDAIRSIRIILQKLVDAVMEANSTRQKKANTDLAAVAE